MAFGAALNGFAQGFVGGLKAGQDFQKNRTLTGLYDEELRDKRKKREAEEQGATNANRRIAARGGSTASTGGVTSQAIATPQALTPASEPQTPESTVAAAIPEAMYDDSEQSRYAEGGVVRPEDQPPAAIPMAAPQAAPAPAAPAAPAQAITPPGNAPPAAAPAAPPANYNDPQLADKVPDPVSGGLEYMRERFGLNQQAAAPAAPAAPGAVPPPQGQPDPQRMQALTAMARGEGAATNEEVNQVARRVDPKGEMPLAQRNTIMLEEMSAAYYSRGMIKEGNEAAASLLQNFRRNMQMYGGMAVAAAENGNMQQAGELLTQAYAYVPDGNTVQARRSGGGIELVTTGPDGKPKPGREVPLPDANAVRNAVGYSMDMDKWAGHLLNERKANAEIELGQGRLAETTRHNRAAEGLSAANLAESRASRGEARSARQRAEERLVSGEAAGTEARLAGVAATRAKEKLDALPEDAPDEQRAAALTTYEQARDRRDELRARTPSGIDARINSMETQDENVALRRQQQQDAQAERVLRQRAAAEQDPLKKQKLEEEIANLRARTARTQNGPAAGAGRGNLTFADRGKVDEEVDNLAGTLQPAEREQARNAASLLGSYVTGVSARDVAQLGLAAQRGEFTPRGQRDGMAVLEINNREISVPLSVAATLRPAWDKREQATRDMAARAGQPGVLSQVGTGLVNQLSGRNRPEPAPLAAEDSTGGTSVARAAQIVADRLRTGSRLNEAQVDRLVRETAARSSVPYEALRRAVTQ